MAYTDVVNTLRWNGLKGRWQLRLVMVGSSQGQWFDLPARIARDEVARAKAAAKTVKRIDARKRPS
jgi:hypothetical protein